MIHLFIKKFSNPFKLYEIKIISLAQWVFDIPYEPRKLVTPRPWVSAKLQRAKTKSKRDPSSRIEHQTRVKTTPKIPNEFLLSKYHFPACFNQNPTRKDEKVMLQWRYLLFRGVRGGFRARDWYQQIDLEKVVKMVVLFLW